MEIRTSKVFCAQPNLARYKQRGDSKTHIAHTFSLAIVGSMERRDRSRSREREFKVEADLAKGEGRGELEEDDRGRKLDRGA